MGKGCIRTRSVGDRRRGWHGRAVGRTFSWGGRCWDCLCGIGGILRAFGAWLGEALEKDQRPCWLRSTQLGGMMGIGVV